MAKALRTFYEKDASLAGLKGKTVAMLGFGSQGHAHREPPRQRREGHGCQMPDTANAKLAMEHGFPAVAVEEAVSPAT